MPPLRAGRPDAHGYHVHAVLDLLLAQRAEARPPAPRTNRARSREAAALPARYIDHGWRDEGFESPIEKVCIDWINTKPDCSLDAVLKNNPDLAEKLKHAKPVNWALKKEYERQQDNRRGKFI